MYQILRPITFHLSTLYKKARPEFFVNFPQIFLFNFCCVALQIALARVQHPDASLSLSLYLLKSWPSFATITCIQQQLLTHTHTHIYRHRHIEFFTMSRPLCFSLRRIDFLVLPIFTFFNFESISDFQIFYIFSVS